MLCSRPEAHSAPNVEEAPSAECPIGPGSTCPSPAQRGRGEPGTHLGHEVLGPAGAAPLGSTRRRSPVRVVLSSLALVFAAWPACNAVLGIDDATLCSDDSCDGGVPAVSEGVAPNLPGSGQGSGDDAGVEAASPGSGSETLPPVQGVNTPGATDGSNSGSSGSGSSGSGSSGSGSSDSSNSGSGSGGSSNSGSSNGGPTPPPPDPGGGDDDDPPPPSACDGRADGSAFCDGATRISCGPGGSVAGSLPCPTVAHCTQSTATACAACLTGEARCTGAILSVCNAAHTGFDTAACAGPAQCNATLARCDAAACVANQLRCEGAVLQVCNATLTGFDPVVDCGSPAACNAQTGACNICAPGTRRCVDSGTVGICDSTGQAETRIDCTPLIESCAAGECELLGL
jgi:hypothetical protein